MLKTTFDHGHALYMGNKTRRLLRAIHATMSAVTLGFSPAAAVSLQPVALTTIDDRGYPSTRTMIISRKASDLSEIVMNTRRSTKKQDEIEANPKGSLHFQDPRDRGGWVTLKGDISIRPGEADDDVELVMRPNSVECCSYTENKMGDDEGYVPVSMVRSADGWLLK